MFSTHTRMTLSLAFFSISIALGAASSSSKNDLKSTIDPTRALLYYNVKQLETAYLRVAGTPWMQAARTRDEQKRGELIDAFLEKDLEGFDNDPESDDLEKLYALPARAISIKQAVKLCGDEEVLPFLQEAAEERNCSKADLFDDVEFVMQLHRQLLPQDDAIKSYYIVRNLQHAQQRAINFDFVSGKLKELQPQIKTIFSTALKAKQDAITLQESDAELEALWEQTPNPSKDIFAYVEALGRKVYWQSFCLLL